MLTILPKVQKAMVIAFVYTIIFNLPIGWFNFNANNTKAFDLLLQLNLAFLFLTIIFALLLFSGKIGKAIIVLLFAIGGIIGYFVVSFGKTIDPGVIQDILSVETELSIEYFSFYLFFIIIISTAIGIAVCQITVISYQPIMIIMLLMSGALGFSKYLSSSKDARVVFTKYSPMNLFVSGYSFFVHYLPQINKITKKIDLTEYYEFRYLNQSKSPLIVIFIIGESMRGDIISLNGYPQNNMPLLKARTNLISFANARSATTSTKESLPLMLTRAGAHNAHLDAQEKGVISIFRKLGFKTSWIGNQGLFGTFESSYASNALEAETVLTNRDIRRALGRNKLYDSDLLPFIVKQLDENPGDDKFIVVHLLGSHWHFNTRYPQDFPGLQKPVCTSSLPPECSNEEVKNSYFNSILFTDFVLDLILKKLEDKNAIVIYSSDHGISLGENGIMGNAAVGENVPKEQLDIAMFVWMSEQYLQTRPKLLEAIKARQYQPVSHKNLFHSLLGCAGVLSDIILGDLNICNYSKMK